MTIPEGVLDAVRSQAGKYLVQKATIRRRTEASDGRGGKTYDRFDLAVGVPCRLDAGTGNEAENGGRRSAIQTRPLKMPYDTDLRETDQVIVDPEVGDTPAVTAAKTYDVTYVQRTPYDAYRQADVTVAR